MSEKFLVLADGRLDLIKAFITAPVTEYSTSFEILRPRLRICDPITRKYAFNIDLGETAVARGQV